MRAAAWDTLAAGARREFAISAGLLGGLLLSFLTNQVAFCAMISEDYYTVGVGFHNPRN
jgi:hypothetical protein